VSRIGQKPIPLPTGVEATVAGSKVTIRGKLGTLEHALPPGLRASVDAQRRLVVQRSGETKEARALHGLTRALLANHVRGVEAGYEKQLEIVGVSYQCAASGKALTLKLGYANDIVLPIPEGVKVTVPNPTSVSLRGPDRQVVGHFAAQIRAARKPEPYKGKGVRYRGEVVPRKQGKSFVASE